MICITLNQLFLYLKSQDVVYSVAFHNLFQTVYPPDFTSAPGAGALTLSIQESKKTFAQTRPNDVNLFFARKVFMGFTGTFSYMVTFIFCCEESIYGLYGYIFIHGNIYFLLRGKYLWALRVHFHTW